MRWLIKNSINSYNKIGWGSTPTLLFVFQIIVCRDDLFVGDDAHIVPFGFNGNLLRADVGIRPYELSPINSNLFIKTVASG